MHEIIKLREMTYTYVVSHCAAAAGQQRFKSAFSIYYILNVMEQNVSVLVFKMLLVLEIAENKARASEGHSCVVRRPSTASAALISSALMKRERRGRDSPL